jgi:hypothetical protein
MALMSLNIILWAFLKRQDEMIREREREVDGMMRRVKLIRQKTSCNPLSVHQ